MDRVIEKKKGIRAVFRKKNIPYFLAGVFVIFVLWLLLRDTSRWTPTPSPSAMSVSESSTTM